MEVSSQFKIFNHSATSPDGTLLAYLTPTRLQVRLVSTLEIVHSFPLNAPQNARPLGIKWSPPRASQQQTSDAPPPPSSSSPSSRRSKRPKSYRILVADEDNARVFDIRDEKWRAVISNGSGGMGKIVAASFSRTEGEIVLFADFGSKMTVWNLESGRSVEIRDPKYALAKGWGFNQANGVLALLSRPGPQDVVTMHAPVSYKVLKTVVLQSGDAQGIKWSPDGRWLVTWEAAGMGYKVFVHTADGNLYRVYSGEQHEGEVAGLGIKNVEWSPTSEFLAVGGWDGRVSLLNARTFSPMVFLDHTSLIQLPNTPLYQEQVSSTNPVRGYAVVPQPMTAPSAPPTTQSSAPPQVGISIISFNASGTLLASKSDATPTTLFVWDLASMIPRAVFIQHSPIRTATWHPTRPDLLLIQCAHDEPLIYMYDQSSNEPSVIVPGFQKAGGKIDASWVHTPVDAKPIILLGDTKARILIWPGGRDEEVEEEEEEREEEEKEKEKENIQAIPEAVTGGKSETDKGNESDESVFDILSGAPDPPEYDEFDDMEEDVSRLEDTFREKRKVASAPLRHHDQYQEQQDHHRHQQQQQQQQQQEQEQQAYDSGEDEFF